MYKISSCPQKADKLVSDESSARGNLLGVRQPSCHTQKLKKKSLYKS